LIRHIRKKKPDGTVKLGLVIFLVLLILVVGRFVYRYADTATRLNDDAVEQMTQDNYDTALEILNQALEADPNHIQANYHRGICLAQKRRFDEAIAAFDRTTALEPKEANAYFNKGKVLWNEQRWEEALPALEKAIEHATNLEKQNRANAWLLKAESLYELYLDKFHENPEEAGSPAEAIAAFKTYQRERPGAPDKTAVQQKIDILNNPENYREELDRRQKLKKTEIDDKRKGPIKLEELKQQIEEEEREKMRSKPPRKPNK
jgi:tetratricopeptide (TPR) repeat protein